MGFFVFGTFTLSLTHLSCGMIGLISSREDQFAMQIERTSSKTVSGNRRTLVEGNWANATFTLMIKVHSVIMADLFFRISLESVVI